MEINVKADMEGMTRWLTDVQRNQVPFATMTAINETAKLVLPAEIHEMRDVFDRPTPYTLSAFRIRFATKQELRASVEPKDFASKAVAADKFLASQITGGTRHLKRFERALQAVGALPPGHRVVPGEAAKLDQYGNMDRGQIVQILSFFKAFPEMGYRANMNDKKRAMLARGSKSKQGVSYFVGPIGGRSLLGIWQRVQFARGSAVKPIMIFVSYAQYEKRLDYNYVAELVVKKEFVPQFDKAMSRALATAR